MNRDLLRISIWVLLAAMLHGAWGYDVVTQPTQMYVSPYYVWEMSFSPDSKEVMTVRVGGVTLWNRSSGNIVFELAVPGPITTAAYAADGKTILTGGHDGKGGLYNAHTGALLQDFVCTSSIVRAIFCPDGRQVVFGTTRGMVNIFDIQTGKQVKAMRVLEEYVPDDDEVSVEYDYKDFQLTPDGTHILVNVEQYISYGEDEGSSDESLLAVVPFVGGETFIHWIDGHHEERDNPEYEIYSMSPLPDSRHVLVAGDHGYIEVYGLNEDEGPVRSYRNNDHRDYSAVLSRDGKLMATVDDGRTQSPGPAFVVRDAETYEIKRAFGGISERDNLYMVWSPDNQWLLTNDGGIPQLWPVGGSVTPAAWPGGAVTSPNFLNRSGVADYPDLSWYYEESYWGDTSALTTFWWPDALGGQVDARLYRGENWIRNLTTVDFNGGRYDLPLRGLSPHGAYQIRFYNHANTNQYFASGNFNASIDGPWLRIEDHQTTGVQQGATLPLNWDCHLTTGTVKLSLYQQRIFVNDIATGLPIPGHYAWTVAVPAPGDYEVRVKSELDGTIKDVTEPFKVVAP